VTLVVDAAPIIAAADRRSPHLRRVQEILVREAGEIVLPAPVAAEIDYLIGARVGRAARTAFLSDLAAGRFHVACLEPHEYELVLQYDRQYADLDVGLTDL
jgi:predicted nucleic acid-binding protein